MPMILVTDQCAIGQCGFQGDARVLLQNVKAKIRIYEHQHMEQPTAPAIAAMLSTMLYYKYPPCYNLFFTFLKGDSFHIMSTISSQDLTVTAKDPSSATIQLDHMIKSQWSAMALPRISFNHSLITRSDDLTLK